MINFSEGFFGSGKTTSLINDLKKAQGSSCILVFTKSEKEVLLSKNLECDVLTFEEFSLFLIKKLYQNAKIITDIESAAIINEIAQKEFVSDIGLKNYSRSEHFSKELIHFFTTLTDNGISPDDFKTNIDKLIISQTDTKRLNLLSQVFEKFVKKIDEYFLIPAFQFLPKLIANKEIFQHISYQYVFVDNIHKASFLELKFLKQISKDCKIFSYGEKNFLIEKILQPQNTNTLNYLRNLEIKNRAQLLINNSINSLEKSESIRYFAFEDFTEELKNIINEINCKITTKKFNYNDFAIAVNGAHLRQKVADFFKLFDIPTNLTTNLDYKNFTFKVSRYVEICTILQKLSLEKFSLNSLAKARGNSKALFEIHIEELNLYFENILSEIFEDFYIKDRIINLAKQREDLSLVEIVDKNKSFLSEENQIKFYEEIEQISALYKAFCEKRFFDFLTINFSHFEPQNKKTFQQFFKKLSAQVLNLEKLCSQEIINKFDLNLIFDIGKRVFDEQEFETNNVKILSFKDFSGYEFEQVFVPFLTEDNSATKHNRLSFLSPIGAETFLKEMSLSCTNLCSKIEQSEYKKLLASILCKAKQKVILSTHCFEDKKLVLPSPVFNILALRDEKNYKKYPKEETQLSDKMQPQKLSEMQDETLVIAKNEHSFLKLNASSIGQYQKCPRNFYYKTLLNLKEKSSFSASYGTIVHAVLEIFNKKCLKSYTREKMAEIANALFDAKIAPEKAQSVGFDELTLALVTNTSELNLLEMKKNFEEALDELQRNYFFDNPPQAVLTEISFEFEIKDIPNVIFNGRIDAITDNNGVLTVIDYKTGNGYAKKIEKYFDDENLDFEEFPKKQKEYPYQIPLYALAIENAPQFIEKKDIYNLSRKAELQYITVK